MANLTPNPHPVARTVVVTGTSSAIGLATAVELAKAGWNTVATRRNLERASALNDAAADAVRIRSQDPCRERGHRSRGQRFSRRVCGDGGSDRVRTSAGRESARCLRCRLTAALARDLKSPFIYAAARLHPRFSQGRTRSPLAFSSWRSLTDPVLLLHTLEATRFECSSSRPFRCWSSRLRHRVGDGICARPAVAATCRRVEPIYRYIPRIRTFVVRGARGFLPFVCGLRLSVECRELACSNSSSGTLPREIAPTSRVA